MSHSQVDVEQVAARSDDLAAMHRYLEQIGYQVDIPGLRERFPEMAWTSFAEWASSGPVLHDKARGVSGWLASA